MLNPKLSLLKADTLELHYWFNDNSHTIDAVIQNRCEFELLGIIKEIALIFDAEIIIETEPFAEGGFKRWLKIVSKSEKKSAFITTAILLALLSGIIVTPITTSISKITEKLIENIFEDKELTELKKGKYRAEIEYLKLDSELKRQILNQNNAIIKKRSNFYESLDKYPKITKVSIVTEDCKKNPLSDEIEISRDNFKDYILVSDILNPIEIDNAVIEIISPVLKKGNYKWRGIYNGVTLSFIMKSIEFKTLVQSGDIEFKNGSSINCFLEIERKINNDGTEQIINYNIIRVNEYFENDKPIETPEGKFHRQKREADKDQFKISFENNINQ